jgi:hypothetical protein
MLNRSAIRRVSRGAGRGFFAILALLSVPQADGALALGDITFWSGLPAGPGVASAVLVIDWADGSPATAWGYRWLATEVKTGGDLLAAVASADPRLSFVGSSFVQNIGYDSDANAIVDRYRPGYNAATGDYWGYWVNNTVTYHPTNFALNGHVFPPLGSPYDGDGPGRWVESSTGLLSRPLADGSWDGFVYNSGTSGPGNALSALPIPEPTALLMGCVSWVLVSSRRRRL